MSSWGGKRAGAGRPKGSIKAESNRRKVRTVAAFDDEWQLIHSFAQAVKYGNKEKCIIFLETLN